MRAEGSNRRATARAVSLGSDGAAAVAMLAILGHTLTEDAGAVSGASSGPQSGADPAANAVDVAHRVLVAVFGDHAVRSIIAKGRRDLLARAEVLLDAERGRLRSEVDNAGVRPRRGDALREAARVVEEAR